MDCLVIFIATPIVVDALFGAETLRLYGWVCADGVMWAIFKTMPVGAWDKYKKIILNDVEIKGEIITQRI